MVTISDCQINDRKYALRFQGKIGELPNFMERILTVGIRYDKMTKMHSCKVEELLNP